MRLATPLTAPELESAAARAAMAASISPGSTISSASSSGCNSEPGEDRLARAAVADEAREPQVRGAGDDALVARREREPGAALAQDVVHAQQQLAAAADRERLGRGDPQLVGAEDLVDEAEVADREEQVRDLAAVEVREVQAGAEDAAAGVARMVDDAAAQHADLDLVVEQQEVDRRLERAERGVVLGVEVTRVAELDRADVAGALHVGLAEVECARLAEAVDLVDGERCGRQHRLDQVPAGVGLREHVGEERALRDLQPRLGRERLVGLVRDLLRGRQTRRLVHQILRADGPCEPFGDVEIEPARLHEQESTPKWP